MVFRSMMTRIKDSTLEWGGLVGFHVVTNTYIHTKMQRILGEQGGLIITVHEGKYAVANPFEREQEFLNVSLITATH